MATAKLKRHQALIWLPARAVGERAFGAEASLIVHTGGEPTPVARRASLDSLEGIRQVWLIADARDVNLIEAKLPPLSGARLKQALPNVTEEFLLQDVSRCLLAPGPVIDDDRRLVAVIDREWVEFVLGALDRRKIRVESLWPAQLVLPMDDGCWSVAALHGALTLRTGATSGLGWNVGDDPAHRSEAVTAMLEAAGLASAPPETLYAFVENASWEVPVRLAAERAGLTVEFGRLPLVRNAPVDLLDGRASGVKAAMARFDWRLWRLPAALAAACVIASLIGLNIHWGMLAAEKASLRQAMVRTYRSAFPGSDVIVDPALQMRRNLTTQRAQGGRSGPEDFVPMFATFAQAIGAQAQDGLAAVEFREGKLKVRFNPNAVSRSGARDQLRQACARLGLKLQFDNERDPTAVVSVQGA